MTQRIEDTRETSRKPLELARDHRLERYFQNTNEAAVERLANRYKDLIPPERVEAVRQNQGLFINDREIFDALYEYESGARPEPGAKILGYSMGASERPRIATDYLEVPHTIEHEVLHQLSEPGVEKQLGRRLDEGITEDLAIENLGVEHIEGGGQSYTEERRLAREVRELCGDSAVEKAYFQGNTTELRQCLDNALGPQGLERLRARLGDSPDAMERRV